MMEKIGLLFCMVMVVIAMVGSNALGYVGFVQITSDADCGITAPSSYTHAISGGGTPTVNGLEFVADMGTAVTGGPQNLGTRAVFTKTHSGITPPLITGNIATVVTTMYYNGSGYFELTGLTSGQWYDLRIYEHAWTDGPAGREFTAAYDVDSDGSVEYTTPVIGSNDSSSSPINLPAGCTWAMSYLYQAGTAGTIKMTLDNLTNGLHFYGLTNNTTDERPPAPPIIAGTPDPSNDEVGVAVDIAELSWVAPGPLALDGGTLEGYDVYVDTDLSDVEAATAATPGTLYSSIGQTGTSFAPGEDLSYDRTYYWRVDTIVDSGSGPEVFAGDVWSFSTMRDPSIIVAKTLLFEDFAGGGVNPLNGTMPDVGDDAWAAHAAWFDDGQMDGHLTNACLPFTPEVGARYVLSGTMNSTNDGGWMGIGFANTTGAGGNLSQGGLGSGWFLETGTGSVTTFRGPGTADSAADTLTPGIMDFRTVLDTRSALWTVEWFFAAPAGTPLVSSRGPVAFTANPGIQSVFVNNYHGAVDFDRISLIESELYNAWSPEGMVPSGDVTLSWEFADYAPVVDVWYGTDPEAMTLLLDNEPNTTTSATITDLSINETYYWRIDPYLAGTSADPNEGSVWTFSTPGCVTNPVPSDGMAAAALSTELTWGAPYPNLTYNVYFGTDFNAVAQAGDIGLKDLLLLAEQWLNVGDLQADRNDDSKVDLVDFSLLAKIWNCPEFKGNQTGNTFDPGGLTEATTYYWRVDAVDASGNVYPGEVWNFSTYNIASIQQTMINYYDTGVPILFANQKQPGYDPTNDPHDIMAGEYRGTFSCRSQEGNYILAYVYQEPRSSYYRNSDVLDNILLSLDYICRAQGSNGGFNEREDQGGWCGVALPNGGNNTRETGICTVIGFTMHSWAKCILTLQNEPAFVSALDEYIDNDGNGTKDVTRRDAYTYLMNNDMNDGSMTGVIQCMMTGIGNGGRPNQGVGAMAAVSDCNLAYEFLTGTAYLTQGQLYDNREDVLTNRFFTRWWSSKSMGLENGHGATGYDAGYGIITMHMFGTYLKNVNDTVLEDFFDDYMSGYKYYWVVDDALPKGGYHEYRTARRQGFSGLPVYVSGICQQYHPAFEMMFDKGLAAYVKNPALYGFGGFWPYKLECTKIADLLLNWTDPVDSDYVLPCNDTATFTYTDSGANLEVTKTGAGPETVTWKAFNFDGDTISYTYGDSGIVVH
jgi:hypothetical protein